MVWQFSLSVLPIFLAAAVSFFVAALVWQSPSVAGGERLLALLLGTGWWSMLYGVALLRTDLTSKLALYAAMYVGVAFVPVAWLLFVVDYVGLDEWLTRTRLYALLIVPACTVGLVATNEPLGVHELFWTNVGLDSTGPLVTMTYGHGPWFWVHTVYAYALLGVSAIYLLRLALFSDRTYRLQAASMIVAVAVPVLANLLFLAGVFPPWLDVTSPALVVSALVLAATVYRYRLLTVVPAARQLARSELIATTPDPVLVVDSGGDLLDLNPAAAGLFDANRSTAVGRPLARLSTGLAEAIDAVDAGAIHTELAIDEGAGQRYFDVQAAPLSANYGVVTGRLISLRDVTDRRRREQRISVLNRLLRHDLRNVMTTIRGNAEFVSFESNDSTVTARMDVIERNVDTIVERRDKFDRVLRSLDVEATPVDVVELTDDVVENACRRFPDVEITLDTPEECWIDGHGALSTALSELLENAVEHAGDGSSVTVSITTEANVATVEVRDDGPGIPEHEIEPIVSGRETPLEHSSGVGLWVVKWIVESLDGRLEFSTAPASRVTLRLPRTRPDDR